MLLSHDLVFVGYRGVDGSVVLTDKKMGKAMTGKRFPLLSDASLDAITAVMKGYFDGLEEEGIDMNHYTMMDVIDDLEYTRKILGYGKVNLLGYSYGTRLALIYSMRYPESIHRIVLAGANPPGHFYWYAEKTEQVLNRWDSICITGGKGSLREAMKKALDHMPERWMCYTLNKDKIRCGTFLALSQNNLAIMVFDAYFRAAAKNDYSGLYMVSLLFDMSMKKITWGDMYSKGASADMQAGFNYRNQLRASDSTTQLGPNVSLLLWGSIGAWNYPLIPDEYRKMRIIHTETLVVSGDLDVPTPTDFARDELMPWLPNGKQFILKNYSHGDIQTAQSEAFDHLVTCFFETGVTDTSRFTPQALPLDPAKKLHRIAKRAFPLVVILGWIY
jgi:pimeloyl-ACP methyl ester carboxylesterase